MSAIGGPNIIEDGLVLYLDAGNRKSYPGSGTTWFDKSGGDNNGTLTNGPTFNTGSLGSIVFDGVDDYVNTVDTPLRFGNTFSLSVWYYWDGINTFAAIVAKRNGQLSFTQYAFVIIENINSGGTSNKIRFIMIPSNAAQHSLFYSMPSAGWYHAFATVAPLEQKLYVNGILRETNDNNYSSTNFNVVNRNMLIGATWNDAGTGITTPYNNRISNVAAYNRTLSAQEVLQNYNATKGRFGL
jgi:hypothetical protein